VSRVAIVQYPFAISQLPKSLPFARRLPLHHAHLLLPFRSARLPRTRETGIWSGIDCAPLSLMD
jgi:hypothetical protein